MERKLKYVSPEYQLELETLGDSLLRQRNVGSAALDDTVEFPAITEHLVLGEE